VADELATVAERWSWWSDRCGELVRSALVALNANSGTAPSLVWGWSSKVGRNSIDLCDQRHSPWR
jgi:hypothetical protein